LCILSEIKDKLGIKILTDVHEPHDCVTVAEVVDVIQIPALLCRQTDLIIAAVETGKTVNVKKGQFLDPLDVGFVRLKMNIGSYSDFWITERGSCFGYRDLIVDFRNFEYLRSIGFKVVYDASHSSANRKFIPTLARAATAAGIDGLFIEVHPEPNKALCDGKTSLRLDEVKPLLESLLSIEQSLDHGLRSL
jgi:2-dehydro-3-deoxyphosphooctonate aldolase (KDO 8-P synthase)